MTNANITRTETRAATARARWERLAAVAIGIAAALAEASEAADADFTRGTADWFDMAIELLPETEAYRDNAEVRAFIALIEDGE